MKFLAIKECPGQLPGTIFEATQDAGMVLVSVGAAKVYDEATDLPEPKKRRQYRRRDLEARA